MHRSILTSALAALAILGLSACGDSGLTAEGYVLAEGGDIESGFDLPSGTRLDDGMLGEAGRISGLCELRWIGDELDGVDVWALNVEIQRGETSDLGLRSVSFLARSDAAPEDGRVEAHLRGREHTSGEAGCRVEVDFTGANSGHVALDSACDVTDADGNSATVTATLELRGCIQVL